MKRLLVLLTVLVLAGIVSVPVILAAGPTPYTPAEGALAPVPMAQGAQAAFDNLKFKGDKPPRIAYMPPATVSNYYIAIGEGVKAKAAELKGETFMLAPQMDSDVAAQMKMIQDVITQDVDAIILSTHDEKAAAPLVKQAVDKGIVVILVNSDIADFPTPVHGVVGYAQRRGTYKMGMFAAGMVKAKAKVGVLEGLPGYHSTERIGGFLDSFKQFPDMEVVASLPTEWNVETGNKAAMDLLQAHPEVKVVVCANDYIAIGASTASMALNRKDVLIFGNDGDTTGMEQIFDGKFVATVNTTPFVMGKIALQVAVDALNKKYPGGWTETPVTIVNNTNVADFLCHPENLYPKPAKQYKCAHPAK